jgi:GTP-binding protein EngB required for normal cell division
MADEFGKLENDNLNTTRFFEAMSDIYKFGIKLTEFPKVILVGMQSGGKSSVCEALSGNGKGMLPKFMGMGTMKPMYITTIKNETSRYKVGDKEFNGEEGAKEEISKLNQNPYVKEIYITVYGPNIQNSQFVDLPGLFHTDKMNPELPKKIAEITKEFLKDKNNIIAIIHSAGTDIATNKALSYVEKANMENNSIGIITKTDLIDSGSMNMIQDLLSG